MGYSKLPPQPPAAQLSDSAQLFCRHIQMFAANKSSFAPPKVGVAGNIGVFRRGSGVVRVRELEPGDEILRQTHGYAKVSGISRSRSDALHQEWCVEVQEDSATASNFHVVHPMQPVVVKGRGATKNLFGRGRVILPAILAGPFLGARMRPAQDRELIEISTAQPELVWAPCFQFVTTQDVRVWDRGIFPKAVDDIQLLRWALLFGFQVDEFLSTGSMATVFEKYLSSCTPNSSFSSR